jgi:hypothetical protein
VTTGFDNVFTDAAVKAEFATTIEKWAQGGQSPKLSAAVKAKRK